ncbi:MAG: type II toxin-antitoxin system HigB family toxin [Pirellulales bacterium]
MHVIARPAIDEAKQRFPMASHWLDGWWLEASKSHWTRLADVRRAYPGTDEVGQCLVFNVCGNDYRLICRMSYANEWTKGTLLVKHFLTHADYSKNRWCKDCIPPEN